MRTNNGTRLFFAAMATALVLLGVVGLFMLKPAMGAAEALEKHTNRTEQVLDQVRASERGDPNQ